MVNTGKLSEVLKDCLMAIFAMELLMVNDC